MSKSGTYSDSTLVILKEGYGYASMTQQSK